MNNANNAQEIRSTAKHFPRIVPLGLLTDVQHAFAGCIAKLRAGTSSIVLLIITTGFIAPGAHAATMLFKTNFGPTETTLYAPYIAYSTAGWQDIAGINVSTGALGPITPWGATASGFDLIADAPVTLPTLGNYLTNEIQQVTGPDGNQVYALFQNLKINNAAPPVWGSSQDAFTILRGSVSNGDKADTGDVYFTYWFKFQSDLHTQLGTGIVPGDNWRVMSEWKTGGLNNTWTGDYRIVTTVSQDPQGNLYWVAQGDNVANGGLPKQIYWQIINNSVPVPVGEWFKYEVFWHRSSGSDGRYWAAVNGQVIVDYKGSNMGIYSLPINRIMLTNAYSGGKAPIQQWVTGLEIWDNFPCGVGASCYSNTNANDTTAPTAPSGLSATAVSSTVNLAWNSATDNVGVTGYSIYRNGAGIATSSTTSFTDSSVVVGTTNNYTVKAYDVAGNLSASSNTAKVKTSLKITSFNAANITTNSANINCNTNFPSTSVLSYGPTIKLGLQVSDNNLSTSHSAQITGLKRGTYYYYNIRATSGSANVLSTTSRFKTAP